MSSLHVLCSLLFVVVCVYSGALIVSVLPSERRDGGREAGVGAPPSRRVPAGNHRGHRSRQPHHRASETEGKGEFRLLHVLPLDRPHVDQDAAQMVINPDPAQ